VTSGAIHHLSWRSAFGPIAARFAALGAAFRWPGRAAADGAATDPAATDPAATDPAATDRAATDRAGSAVGGDVPVPSGAPGSSAGRGRV
jgi:hypothetical protein